MSHDLCTRAIVLRRTNYGETDRILSLLTPEGKLSALAKGVRKERSKLAGGIELFSISEITVHHKTNDTEGLGILTSAKMVYFYSQLLTNLDKIAFLSQLLKKVSQLAEHISTPELFSLVYQTYHFLNESDNLVLADVWCQFNLAKISGTDINLLYDTHGQPLAVEQTYSWDTIEQALSLSSQGHVTADHIKLMRLMLNLPLQAVSHIQHLGQLLPEAEYIAKTLSF